jgi:hypothetical protein
MTGVGVPPSRTVMSSIMRWRNGLGALSIMAIAPVSHGVTNAMILRQNEPSCYVSASRTPSPENLPSARFGPYAAEVVLSHSLPSALAERHLT